MYEQKYKIPICTGIVTYNPDITLFAQCISAISSQVDSVFIFDNSSINFDEIEKISHLFKAVIISSSQNVGIARALNELCKLAFNKGFKWIITMDQDSICNLTMADNLLSYVDDKYGIIAPRVEFWSDNNLIEATKNAEKECVEIAACITSGSLTNLVAWNEIGGFDEWFFIDHVDNEICTHLRVQGYKILRVNNAILYQRAGEMQCLSLPFNKKILLPYYSPFRNYYICRNTVYYLRKYRKHINFMHELLTFIYSQFIKILFEGGRKKSIESTWKGIKDGFVRKIQ